MPAARGLKRTASKSSAATASTAPKSKKKRGAIQLDIPSAPKKRGCVLACGQGDVGQLGLGEDVVETSKFKYVAALGDKIVDVCAGGMHTIALDSDGKVWTFGCNDEGALGRATGGGGGGGGGGSGAADGGEAADEGVPARVTLPRRAVAVAAGDSHSAALLDNGDVYAWGAFRDSHGSMGLVVRGREGKSCREPVKVDIGKPAVAIASGGDHLVILSDSGSVYTMGCGEQGQLGRLSQRSASRDARQGFSALLVPSKVTLKGGACRIWAGYHATFALDATNEKMFAWGLNNYGQLGITGEKRKTALFSPTECDAFASGGGGEWRAVACGQHHSLALDNSGQVYAIGRCEYGRLGLGERSSDAETLEPIPKLQNKKCINIAAGTSNSFAVTDTGEVYAWGMGSEGQLGTGQCADAAEPVAAAVGAAAAAAALAARCATRVSAGGQHTVVLLEDPTVQKEPSPSPEKETAEQKTEEKVEERKQEKEKEKSRPTKRQKKQEQEEEVSSTSSAQPSEVSEESKPQKLNGDEKKETPMEVDDTDNPQDKQDDTKSDEQSKDTEQRDGAEQKEESKPETTDTSSQGTSDGETKSQDTGDTREEMNDRDVDMREDRAEVNGTPETQIVGAKTVDESIPSDTALVTTA